MSEFSTEDAEEYTQALGQVVAGGWRQVALGKRLGVPAALGISVEEWVEGRLGGYVRMSIPERRQAVAELTEEGMSTREIEEVLGVDHTTVSRDVVANATPEDETLPSEADATGPGVANATENGSLTIALNDESLERQQRETLIAGLDRAIRALELPESHAHAEVRRLLVGGDAGPFTPSRFETAAAFASAFADALREEGING